MDSSLRDGIDCFLLSLRECRAENKSRHYGDGLRRSVKFLLYAMARKRRICFWARSLVVHLEKKRFDLRFITW